MDVKGLELTPKKLKNWLDGGCLLAGIVCLLIMCLREISFLKNLIRRYLFLFGGENLFDHVRMFYDTHMWRWIYWGFLISMVILSVENVAIKIFCRMKDKKLTPSDDMEKRLFPYLDDTRKARKCFAVLGEWGTGKTYRLNQSLGRYMRYKFRPCYQISCFGLKDRAEILDAIKSVCRQQDSSIMQTMIDWIQYVPALGPWLSAALEKQYELGDLSEKSIFVFEDFERIAGSESKKEEKYNLIVGFINEIIERYHYKTIIVCNNIEMKTFYTDLFHKKLDCEEYKLPSQNDEAYDIAKREFESDNRLLKEEVYNLLRVVESEIVRMVQIFNQANMKNLRKLVRVFRTLAIYEKTADWEIEKRWKDYNWKCILYSTLYREILEKTDWDPTRYYSESSGRLFFDVYIDFMEINGGGADIVLKSLLDAPSELVYIAFESEKLNSDMRQDIERMIQTEKEKAACFSRWVNAKEISPEDVKSTIDRTGYGLMILVKCLIYIAFHGEKSRKLYIDYLDILKEIEIDPIRETVNYEHILSYLYDMRICYYEIQIDYMDVLKEILRITKERYPYLDDNGRRCYDDLCEREQEFQKGIVVE